MDGEQVISYGVIGVAISFAISMIINFRKKRASQEVGDNVKDEIELKIGKFYQIVGYHGIVMAFIFPIGALFYQETEMYIMGVTLFLLFGGLGLLLVMYYRNHRLRFDDHKIIVHSWRNKIEEITWQEIEEIKFNQTSGYLKIMGINKKLLIHKDLVGLHEFIQKMEEKTDWIHLS